MSPWSDRMHKAFASPTDWETRKHTSTRWELLKALKFAKTMDVDLIALGGDLVNFPSPESVNDVYQELAKLRTPFLYTAGNHDWHLEKLNGWETTFDAQMKPNENGPLKKLYTASGKGLKGEMSDPRFGYVEVTDGLRVVCIDNSNFLIDSDQLHFFLQMMNSSEFLVLLMHIPIYFPGLTWGPSDVMGHPFWGAATDQNAEVEERQKWPLEAPQLVKDFIQSVKTAAEKRQLLAILTGHTHENGVVPVPCASTCDDSGVKQFTSRPNFGGGSRLLVLRMPNTAGTTTTAQEAPKWQTPPPNRWMLHVDLDLRLAAAALLVFGIFYFWRRSRLPCRTGNSSEREPYILGASEPKTWEEEQAAI